jgi:dTDP-4-dehydrorhamnose reductase
VSSGLASWFDFARAIFESAGADPQLVRPVPSSTMPRPAPRPMYSALENDRCWQPIGLPPLPDWQVAWKTASAELTAAAATA